MKLKLYYSSKTEPLDDRRNDGFSDLCTLLTQLEGYGIECYWIDTSQLTNEQIRKTYIHSVTGPTKLKKYQVRQVFDSARHSGWFFGRQVPALVVYESERQVPNDVFPHDMGGRIVTIKEYLERILRSFTPEGMVEALIRPYATMQENE